jgi:hypothetical protein
MAPAHGYKANYDYVDLFVEPHEGRWRVRLQDRRYAEDVVHEDEFDCVEDAQDAALTLAQHHINIQHNDTLLARSILAWREY